MLEMLDEVKETFVSKIERGINFNFMRLDASLEPEFAAMFNGGTVLSATDLPMFVVLNPGKRKRFLKHDGAQTAKELTTTLDKILGGDARFKAIKDLKSLNTSYETYVQ